MNYIKQLNEFYTTLDYKPLPANAIAIYTILLQIANRTGWIDKFRVANNVLMSKCDLDLQKLIRARNKLINQGYIIYIKGRNQLEAPIYSIVKLYDNNKANDIAGNIADNSPNDIADNSVDNKADNSINKQNKTKQIYPSSNDEEMKKHFELIWEAYPNKKGRAKAEQYFMQWLKGRKINKTTIKLTDKQMWYAVSKYKKECEEKETELQYIKHGDTFFNKAILDYVEALNE